MTNKRYGARAVVTLGCLLILSFSAAARADYERGLAAYRAGDLVKAADQFRRGDPTSPPAQRVIRTVLDDLERARETKVWPLSPERFGEVLDFLSVAILWAPAAVQREVAQNYGRLGSTLPYRDKRRFWLEAAVKNGDGTAMWELRLILPASPDSPENETRAIALTRAAAAAGNPSAQHALGLELVAPPQIRKLEYNPAEARIWLKRASDQDKNPGVRDLARTALARLLAKGEGGPQDCSTAIQLISEVQKSHYYMPALVLAELIGQGICFGKDEALAAQWARLRRPNTE